MRWAKKMLLKGVLGTAFPEFLGLAGRVRAAGLFIYTWTRRCRGAGPRLSWTLQGGPAAAKEGTQGGTLGTRPAGGGYLWR